MPQLYQKTLSFKCVISHNGSVICPLYCINKLLEDTFFFIFLFILLPWSCLNPFPVDLNPPSEEARMSLWKVNDSFFTQILICMSSPSPLRSISISLSLEKNPTHIYWGEFGSFMVSFNLSWLGLFFYCWLRVRSTNWIQKKPPKLFGSSLEEQSITS